MIDRDYFLCLCEEAQNNYESYKADAEKNVSSWEFTTGKRYDLRPYWFEINHEAKARITKNESSSYYGFDEERNIRIAAYDDSTAIVGYRTISKDKIINRLYNNGNIDSIEEITLGDGLPIKWVNFIVRNGRNLESSWHFEEDYLYESDLLTTIKHKYWSNIGPNGRGYQMQGESLFHLHYSRDNKLSHINDQRDKTIYLNIKKSEAAALREIVREGLILETFNILQEIGKKLDNDIICFLGIYLHDMPNGIYDPIFQSGIEKVRLIQLEEKSDLDTIWSSSEHPSKYQETILDKTLSNHFERLVQYWEMTDKWWREGKKLWHEVAQELNKRDWKAVLPVTDDFVVFVDEEAFNVRKDLVKNVPIEKLDILRSKGLLTNQ